VKKVWATGVGAVERLCVEDNLVREGLDGDAVDDEETSGGDDD
jgi:hypothetical protein